MEWKMENDRLINAVVEAQENDTIEKRRGDQAPEGYYTDDLGWWVEQDIRRDKMRFARYVYVRCRKMNEHLHLRNDELLFNSHTLIEKHPNDIAELAGLPEVISTPIATWVYNRLVETVPRLDSDRIVVAGDLVWNMETCEFENWAGKDYATVS